MKELIGLYHLDGNLERLVEFVDSRFGTPESLMLELPLDWREEKDRLTTDNYFYTLAEEYEPRGTKIMAGDRKKYIVDPKHPDEFLEFEKQLRNGEWQPENIVEWSNGFFGLLGEMFRYKAKLRINHLSSAKAIERNEGLLEAFNEQDPQVTIVGDEHARYLKSQRPDTHYTYFMIDSPLYHFLHMRDNVFWRKTAYDSLQVSPPSKK